MALGDGFSRSQRADLQRSIDLAREICGLGFGVYIGPLANGRESAIAAHAQLPDAARAVLVALDPTARTIDIVTGVDAARMVDDRSCELAVLAVRSSVEADDLVGGVRNAVTLLAQHARAPRVQHLDEPA